MDWLEHVPVEPSAAITLYRAKAMAFWSPQAEAVRAGVE